jgi:hypothetical protein
MHASTPSACLGISALVRHRHPQLSAYTGNLTDQEPEQGRASGMAEGSWKGKPCSRMATIRNMGCRGVLTLTAVRLVMLLTMLKMMKGIMIALRRVRRR